MNGLLYSTRKHRTYLPLPEFTSHTRLPARWTSAAHRHAVYHLVFVLEGTGTLENNHGHLELKSGCLVLINPREKHIFRTRNSELYYFACNFHLLPLAVMEKAGGWAAALQRDKAWREKHAEITPLEKLFEMTVDRGLVHYDPRHWPRITGMAQALAEGARTNNSQQMRGLFRFLYTLFDEVLALDRAKAAADPLVKKVEEYLAQHVREKLKLVDLAKAMDYNPSYLSGYFRKKQRTTITACFNRLKAQRSAELLKTTTQPLTDIAFEMGYSSSQHFCMRFKECKGMTPRKYRYLAETT